MRSSSKWLIVFPASVVVLMLIVMLILYKQPKAILQINPMSGCEGEHATILEVSWDVRPLGLKIARLEVDNLTGTSKLWVTAGENGSEKTGNWVFDGWTVKLYAMNGVELARQTYVTTDCRNNF